MTNTLSLPQIIGLLTCALMLAIGQILFKRTAETAGSLNSFNSVLTLVTIPSFWIAGILYAGSTIIWIKLLQTVPLSRAYPFSALGFVLVPMAAYLFFKESITPQYIFGGLLIIIGILITARG
jgi:drug/metabolite transporter (DMT)-like permease